MRRAKFRRRILGASGAYPFARSGNLYHILHTGQSLQLGGAGRPPIQGRTKYSNFDLNSARDTLVRIQNTSDEEPRLASADWKTSVEGWVSVHTQHSGGGRAYQDLKQGTSYYVDALDAVQGVEDIINASGGAYTGRVYLVDLVHGEQDEKDHNNKALYKSYLLEWQDDYNTDIKAITGQTEDVPFVLCQISSHAYSSICNITLAQYEVCKENPTTHFLACPKYMFEYVDASHMDAESYQWLGELHGKVHREIINNGTWAPVWPLSVVRTGATIVATFNVPEPPLVLDDTIVPLANSAYGFEFSQTSGNVVTISNVAITDTDEVTITLSATPTGTNQRLRYAYSKLDSVTLTPRGNLRDSDAAVSLWGHPLYNWCVHFDEAVTT